MAHNSQTNSVNQFDVAITHNQGRYTTFEENIELIIAECLDAYMEDSVDHFLKARSRNMDDDGRYFYAKSELAEFKRRFMEAGGDLGKLHIGTVYVRDDELYPEESKAPGMSFYCYEVCRKRYYDRESYYSKQQHDEGGQQKMFFS